MLTRRDATFVAGTLLAVSVFRIGARYVYKKLGEAYKRRHPLTLSQSLNTSSDDIDVATSVEDNGSTAISRRIRKAETVLQRRTSRILLVLEASCDMFNQQAVLRTAECMGIQHVWIVEPAYYKQVKSVRRIARQSTEWLSLRHFKTTESCIKELHLKGYEIWATDLGQGAESLDQGISQIPERLAIVMGREADGVSQTMLQAAKRRVYLSIHGFADSLNLNVATGMVLQRLFFICSEARGLMEEDERSRLREEWYQKLARPCEDVEAHIRNPPPPYRDLRRPNDHRNAWMEGKIRRRILAKEEELKRIDSIT